MDDFMGVLVLITIPSTYKSLESSSILRPRKTLKSFRQLPLLGKTCSTSPLSYLTVSDHPIILSQQQYYCIDPDHKDTQHPAEVLSMPTARPPHRFSPEAGSLVKKANHNATERDRRKKINSLFSSLRSLLPLAEQKKKLSIPATISRVLKYIPELQAQIQLLTQEKQRLLSCASDDRRCCGIDTEQRRAEPRKIAGLTVESTCWRSEREAMIRICQGGHSDKDISEILLDLEGNGFSLTSASGFKSCGGNFLHNLHVWVGEDSRSPQDGQNKVFHGERLDFFDSEYLWPTIGFMQGLTL